MHLLCLGSCVSARRLPCAGAEQFVDSALEGGALVAVLCNTSGFGATSGLSEAAVAALGPQAQRVRVLSSGGGTASSFEGGLEAAKAQACLGQQKCAALPLRDDSAQTHLPRNLHGCLSPALMLGTKHK